MNKIVVCMNINIFVENGTSESFFSRQWEMGTCHGPKRIYDEYTVVEFATNYTYVDRCCLKPGNYTLTCKSNGFGWGGGFITIFGYKYCDDFVGFRGMRRVLVTGYSMKLYLYIFQ